MSIKWVEISQMTVMWQCGCGVLSIIFECQQFIYQARKILRLIDNPKFLMSTCTEWSLSDTVFIQIRKKFFYTNHRLFCISHLNHKDDSYVSWHPDPGALPVAQLFYAFPPFSLITRMLQKGREDRAERCIVIVLL